MIQWMLAIWSLVPLPFLNPAWTSGCSWFTYCWSLAWRILSITLVACEMSAIVWSFEDSLALPFFGIRMKTDLFQFCGYCCIFQICWHIECSTFTASPFRIWNVTLSHEQYKQELELWQAILNGEDLPWHKVHQYFKGLTLKIVPILWPPDADPWPVYVYHHILIRSCFIQSLYQQLSNI